MGKYSRAKKSIYKPRNPKKWINEGKIQSRSGIEQKWFTFFDLNSSVISIASERIIIPYFDPVNNKQRKYYVDLIVKFRDKNGDIKIKLIEIKSYSESIAPKKPKRITNNYKSAVLTWITNQAKWEAATRFAIKKGWEFVVLTEKNL